MTGNGFLDDMSSLLQNPLAGKNIGHRVIMVNPPVYYVYNMPE